MTAHESGSAFPAGARQVPVPAVFFSDLLPLIEDPAEITVTLYAFYLQSRKRSTERWFTEGELRAEAPLLRALRRPGTLPAEELKRGLSQAVRRGTLLAAQREAAAGASVYAVNSAGARSSLARAGALPAAAEGTADEAPEPISNIFLLYEENIGVISPLLAEQLREAREEYPWPWIVAAFREAVALNRRNWRYIERILARWRAEGPDVEAIGRGPRDDRRGHAGRYWRLVEH